VKVVPVTDGIYVEHHKGAGFYVGNFIIYEIEFPAVNILIMPTVWAHLFLLNRCARFCFFVGVNNVERMFL
jgi:hypothetical protein